MRLHALFQRCALPTSDTTAHTFSRVAGIEIEAVTDGIVSAPFGRVYVCPA